jgi:hypothetical protein
MRVRGYAAVYNSLSQDLGGFREMIAPGAFDRTVRETNAGDNDVLGRLEHHVLLGRTSSGTVRLATDARGLLYEIDLPNTQAGRDVAELVSRGDIFQSSFAFHLHPNGEDFDVSPGGWLVRHLLDVDLVDVAPVTTPAYPATSVALVRSATLPQGQPCRAAWRPDKDEPASVVVERGVRYVLEHRGTLPTQPFATARRADAVLDAEQRALSDRFLTEQEALLRLRSTPWRAGARSRRPAGMTRQQAALRLAAL